MNKLGLIEIVECNVIYPHWAIICPECGTKSCDDNEDNDCQTCLWTKALVDVIITSPKSWKVVEHLLEASKCRQQITKLVCKCKNCRKK